MTSDLFDRAGEYDELLQRGLRFTGEHRDYFAGGRLADLRRHFGVDYRPRRILDFGCGIGDTTRLLAASFPDAEVVGLDTAEDAVRHAQRQNMPRVEFALLRETTPDHEFDLCYTNGVFHHIRPEDRDEALQLIQDFLQTNGRFALFENNPWNPGTRFVMSRIPFDADASPLSVIETRHLLERSGFVDVERPRFLFFFPRWLAAMRRFEAPLAHVPIGGQYYFVATRGESL